MAIPVQKALVNAVARLFRPLARVLIRNGISYGTFAEVAKKIYVDTAFEEFQEPGKKQTISRVSVLTGLTRKEAKRLHEQQASDDVEAGERYNRAIRVISGWLNDRRFVDSQGQTKVLPVHGNGASFTSLVKDYSGDIPTQAMLTVLKKAGSVIETDRGIELVNHAFVPGDDAVDKLHILGTDVAELLATIDHNLTHEPDELFFQRKVSNTCVDPAAVPAFRKLSAKKAQALLEVLDAWLSEHEQVQQATDSSDESQYVSLGIYYSEHTHSRESSS